MKYLNVVGCIRSQTCTNCRNSISKLSYNYAEWIWSCWCCPKQKSCLMMPHKLKDMQMETNINFCYINFQQPSLIIFFKKNIIGKVDFKLKIVSFRLNNSIPIKQWPKKISTHKYFLYIWFHPRIIPLIRKDVN